MFNQIETHVKRGEAAFSQNVAEFSMFIYTE